MTQPVVPQTGYASIADYELRTGTDVPAADEPMVQTRLNDVSNLIDVYLGDCADEVAAKYPDVLTALVVANVWRNEAIPAGIRSESVGGTSVSYDTESAELALLPMDTNLLDALMAGACGEMPRGGGVGQIGVTMGGPPEPDEWPQDVDVWVLAGQYRKGGR
jgi:hypothetical protein